MRVDTSAPIPQDPFTQYQVYNGLDCCLTHEIHEVLSEFPDNVIYSFERAMQAPALEMMLRGIRVDLVARGAAVQHLQHQVDRVQDILTTFAQTVWDRPLNESSPKQLQEFFYGTMGLPPQTTYVKGKRVVSTNRDCLEKLQAYFHPRPIIACILKLRDLKKQIDFLTKQVDPDNRIRTSYNIAGTETGRWSSSTNAHGTGTNLQNFPDKLRRVFVADEGRKLAYLDLEQAESRAVGIKLYELFGDSRYIDACEGGDLHTAVARMVWPGLDWTGDSKLDRKIADRLFYRDMSYRDMSKRGGHASNYYGQPHTVAKHLKVETHIIRAFQEAYLPAFGIPAWHRWVASQLQLEGKLTTFLGRERHFFGRANDDTTLREAIAYEPQSVVGDLLNLALWRVWRHSYSDPILLRSKVRILAQLHDAILIDYIDNPEWEHELLARVSAYMRTEIPVRDRVFVIPNDAASGWNWGKYNDDPTKGAINLGGVRKIGTGREDRARPKATGLDIVIPKFDE